ncbi:hypothetical protein D1831_09010 [Lactiplantibacillus garii]|uniref:Uncharacterized protein n=1 Tax=Lactiplantibacillus garii TaxID=2306423 RepID=A0A3R8L0J2_9LACO|nr:hypothetical protein [Lactiplantibacillus garii]RRK10156.1 hypothetical protein D1831_09010 [Lactiplantibacillus garii]
MAPKLILINGQLILGLITAIGGALITAKVDASDLYPVLRCYLIIMLLLGIALDIFGRHVLITSKHDHRDLK